MSQVEKIESQIAELSMSDLAAFRRWFAEFDATVWNQQFAADATAGKLDALATRTAGSLFRSTKF